MKEELKLKEESYKWAIQHLRKFYDSDFFPRSFEFPAIKSDWNNFNVWLSNKNILKHNPSSPVLMLAPKPNHNFRIVHQLDPIDSIIYAALAYEVAESVQNFRDTINPDLQFSYKVNVTDQGELFQGTSSWKEFLDKEQEFLEEYEDGFIVVADVTDFYNQIYLHRIENLVSEASEGTLDLHAKAIELFLTNLTAGNSRGIPVGPSASIVFSELIMADIDRRIRYKAEDFIRYVDDIRIFFKTKSEAIECLHDLTRYLHTYHRLVLSSSKTKLLKVSEYNDEHFKHEESDEMIERQNVLDEEIESRVQELIEEIELSTDDYAFGDLVEHLYENEQMNISEDDEFMAQQEAYKRIYLNITGSETIDYSTLRHILKRATKYRIRSIYDNVLNDLPDLQPVIREACIYLKNVSNAEIIDKNKDEYLSILENPLMAVPFCNMWVSYLFSEKKFATILRKNDIEKFSTLRSKALAARASKKRSWIRQFREHIGTQEPWGRRAVYLAGDVLPKTEAKKWLKKLAQTENKVDRAVCNYVLGKL